MRKHTHLAREFNYDNGSTERQGLYKSHMVNWGCAPFTNKCMHGHDLSGSEEEKNQNYCRNFCKAMCEQCLSDGEKRQ